MSLSVHHSSCRGVALSMMIFDALSPILLIAYIKGRGLHKKTWGGWSWDSLRGWSQFLKYGVAGYLMLAFEWWSFEITTLVTGSISKNHLAANVVIFQLSTIAYMVSAKVIYQYYWVFRYTQCDNSVLSFTLAVFYMPISSSFPCECLKA